jgi:7-carboxy-7-deazaguanine synthase
MSSAPVTDRSSRLRISEIFYSLQGEAATSGLPTVFVRLTGCPLRCQYCDTEYAFTGGDWMDLEAIISRVQTYNTPYVTVTGGEPLAQKNCLVLLQQLADLDYRVSLETSGALDVSSVDPRVSKVVDVKTPASGELEKNLYSNFDCLGPDDQLKFVICDEADYEWSKSLIQQYSLAERCELLFSPSYQQMDATQLADWILRDQLMVRFQVQLHKLLWGDKPGV